MDTTLEHAPFPLLGALASPLAEAAETAGAFEAFRLDLGPGARSPLHTLRAAKLFVVTAGTVRITLGDWAQEVLPGGSVLVPAGTVHAYRNGSDAPAELLVVVGGSDQLAFLRGMSRLAAAGSPDPEAVRAHASAYGVELLPA
jgi:quercetin dioxygenase-like cupin family protein